MAAFIDFNAFTEGGRKANQDNWGDVTNDINTRAAEERLRQAQITFDTGLPIAQFGAEDTYMKQLGARAGQQFGTQVLAGMAKQAPENQADFFAQQLAQGLSNINVSDPGAAQMLESMQTLGWMQADRLRKAGDLAGAEKVYRAIPGVGQAAGNTLQEVSKWSNPATAYNPENLARAAQEWGATYDQATGTITMPGKTPATVNEFVNMRRTFAENQVSNMTPGMEHLENKRLAQGYAKEVQAQYAAQGIPAVIDPVTFKVKPIYNSMTGQVGTPIPQIGAQPNVTGLDQTFGMNMNPLPGATGPTFAAPAVSAMPAVAPAAAVPAIPVAPAAAAALPMPAAGATFNPQVIAQSVDQARAARLGIENALRTLNRQQPGVMTPEKQYYQQELAKAQQVEAQASAKADADALARYQTTLQQQGYVPGRPFTPWLTQGR